MKMMRISDTHTTRVHSSRGYAGLLRGTDKCVCFELRNLFDVKHPDARSAVVGQLLFLCDERSWRFLPDASLLRARSMRSRGAILRTSPSKKSLLAQFGDDDDTSGRSFGNLPAAIRIKSEVCDLISLYLLRTLRRCVTRIVMYRT